MILTIVETGVSWSTMTILRLSSTARCDDENQLGFVKNQFNIAKVASVEVNDDKTVTVGYVDGHHLKPKGNLSSTPMVQIKKTMLLKL